MEIDLRTITDPAELNNQLEIRYRKHITELSLQYFGKVNCQTIMFFTLEHSATIEKVEGYVPSEKVLRKFFKWQSRSFPKKHSLLYAFGDVPFDHKDDLTWLECAKADALLREDDREANAKLSANQKTDFNMDCLNG